MQELPEQGNLFTLINSLPGIIFRCRLSRNWTMEYLSKGCRKVTGYSPDDLIQDRITSYGELIHPEDREYVWRTINDSLRNNEQFQIEYRITTADGMEKWVWEQGHGTGQNKDGLEMLEGFILDITSYRSWKEQLRQSEIKHQDILNSIEEGFYEVDLYGNYVDFNNSFLQITGYSQEELQGKSYKKLTRDPEKLFLKYNQVYRTGTPCKEFQWRMIRKDGLEIIVEVSISLVRDKYDNITGFRGIVRDVKERYRMEEALKHSEERYREILASIEDGYFEVDLSGNFTYINQSLLKYMGYTYEDLIGENYCKVVTEPREVYKVFNRVFETGIPEKGFIMEVMDKNGTTMYIETSISLIQDKNGEITGFRGINRDTTERKKMEMELELQKTHLEALFANSTDAIAFFNEKGRIININAPFTRLFGYEPEDVKGEKLYEVILLSSGVRQTRSFINRILKGEAFEQETESLNRNKITIEILFKGVPVAINGKIVGGYAIYSDITTRKHYEKQLQYISYHDPLTGSYNRTYFEKELEHIHQEKMLPVSIIVADVDNLKFINDTMGHHAGDEMLITCAQLLKHSVRKCDTVARIGGDEFAILLPHTDRETTIKVKERIYRQFNKHIKENPDTALNISLGFSTNTTTEKPLIETYKEADNEMYRNKLARNPKNRENILNLLMNTFNEKELMSSGHTERINKLTVEIGKKIGLTSEHLNNLTLLSHIHNLGNTGISNRVLRKTGELNPEEWEEIKMHPIIGYRIIQASRDFQEISTLVLYHHERWDGTGYPYGLKGEEIPIECRILAIVDAFEALTSNRPYRKALSSKEALGEIKRCAGTQFDPHLVEAFLDLFS